MLGGQIVQGGRLLQPDLLPRRCPKAVAEAEASRFLHPRRRPKSSMAQPKPVDKGDQATTQGDASASMPSGNGPKVDARGPW